MRHASAYEVRRLSKRYESPPVLANDDITFSVEQGEAFGLLGPNGAGKSTLVRQLVGLLRPSSGDVRLFGELLQSRVRGGPSRHDHRVGRTVAYLPQGALALGELKVAEALRWTGQLRGLGTRTVSSELEELLGVLSLERLTDRPIRKLSGGQRRLVQLGMTLIGRLPVLILDEPTADIDVMLRARIWELLRSRARAGAAVILVTHDVAEAEHALDRVAILDGGSLVAAGTPAELKANLAHRTRLDFVVSVQAPLDPAVLAADIGGDTRVRGRHVTAWVPADEAVGRLEKAMAAAGPEALEDVRLVTPTLEDVYLEIGGRSLQEADEDAHE